jgi:hypothetical protein
MDAQKADSPLHCVPDAAATTTTTAAAHGGTGANLDGCVTKGTACHTTASATTTSMPGDCEHTDPLKSDSPLRCVADAGMIKKVLFTTELAGFTTSTFTAGVQWAYRDSLAQSSGSTFATADVKLNIRAPAAAAAAGGGRRLAAGSGPSVTFDVEITVPRNVTGDYRLAGAAVVTALQASPPARFLETFRASLTSAIGSGSFADLPASYVVPANVALVRSAPEVVSIGAPVSGGSGGGGGGGFTDVVVGAKLDARPSCNAVRTLRGMPDGTSLEQHKAHIISVRAAGGEGCFCVNAPNATNAPGGKGRRLSTACSSDKDCLADQECYTPWDGAANGGQGGNGASFCQVKGTVNTMTGGVGAGGDAKAAADANAAADAKAAADALPPCTTIHRAKPATEWKALVEAQSAQGGGRICFCN